MMNVSWNYAAGALFEKYDFEEDKSQGNGRCLAGSSNSAVYVAKVLDPLTILLRDNETLSTTPSSSTTTTTTTTSSSSLMTNTGNNQSNDHTLTTLSSSSVSSGTALPPSSNILSSALFGDQKRTQYVAIKEVAIAVRVHSSELATLLAEAELNTFNTLGTHRHLMRLIDAYAYEPDEYSNTNSNANTGKNGSTKRNSVKFSNHPNNITLPRIHNNNNLPSNHHLAQGYIQRYEQISRNDDMNAADQGIPTNDPEENRRYLDLLPSTGPCYRFVLPLAKGDLTKWMQAICSNENIGNSSITDSSSSFSPYGRIPEPKKLIIFSEPLAADILYQVALAVNYTHKKGMVNRDLKLANIMIFREPGGLEYPKINVPLFDGRNEYADNVICLGYNGDFRRTRGIQLRLNKQKTTVSPSTTQSSTGNENDNGTNLPTDPLESDDPEDFDHKRIVHAFEDTESWGSRVDENRTCSIAERIPYVIIGDFGSAHREDRGTQSFYTEDNCPPEQKGGPDPIVGPKYDAWLVGMVLAVLLLGENVYATPHWRDTMRERSKEKDLLIPDSFGLSPGVKDVLHGLLNPSIKHRLSIEELLEHPWLQPAAARYRQAEANGLFENEEPEQDTIDFYLNKSRMLANRRHWDGVWRTRDADTAQRYENRLLRESLRNSTQHQQGSKSTSPSLGGISLALPPRSNPNPSLMDLALPPRSVPVTGLPLPPSSVTNRSFGSTSSSRNDSGITIGGPIFDTPMTPQVDGVVSSAMIRATPRVVLVHREIVERLNHVLSHLRDRVQLDDNDASNAPSTTVATVSTGRIPSKPPVTNNADDDEDDYLDTALDDEEDEDDEDQGHRDESPDNPVHPSVYGNRGTFANLSSHSTHPSHLSIYNGDMSNMKGTLDEASGRISDIIAQLTDDDVQRNSDNNKHLIGKLRTRIESALTRVRQRIMYQMDGKASHQIMLLCNRLKTVMKEIHAVIPNDTILVSITDRIKLYYDHWVHVAYIEALGRLIVQLNGIGTGGTLHIKLAAAKSLQAFIHNVCLFCEVRNGIEDGKAYRAVRKSLLDALGAVLDGLIRPRTVYANTLDTRKPLVGSPIMYAASPTLGAFTSQEGAMATLAAASAAEATLVFADQSLYAKEILDLAFYGLCRIIRNNFFFDTKPREKGYTLNVYSRDTLSRSLVLLTNIVTSPIFEWGPTTHETFCKLSALLPLAPPFVVDSHGSFTASTMNDTYTSWGILPWGLLWAMTSDRFMLGEDTNWQEFDRITPNIAILVQRALNGSLLLTTDIARLEVPEGCKWLPQAILQIETAAVRLLKGNRTTHLGPIVELLLELSRPEHGPMKAEGHQRIQSDPPAPITVSSPRSPEKMNRYLNVPGYLSPLTVPSHDRSVSDVPNQTVFAKRTLPSPLNTHATVLVAQMLSALNSLSTLHAWKEREMGDTAKIRQACRICALLLALLRPSGDNVPKDPAVRNACLAQVRTGNILLLRSVQLINLIASDAFLLPEDAVEPVVRLLRLCALPASGSRNGEDDPDWEPDSLRRLGRGSSGVPAIRGLLVRYSTSPKVVTACLDLLDDMLDFDIRTASNGTIFQRHEPMSSSSNTWGNSSQAILTDLPARQSDTLSGLHIQPQSVTESMLYGVELLGLNAATREVLMAAVRGAIAGSRIHTPVADRVEARLHSDGMKATVSSAATNPSTTLSVNHAMTAADGLHGNKDEELYRAMYMRQNSEVSLNMHNVHDEHWEGPEIPSTLTQSTTILPFGSAPTTSTNTFSFHRPMLSYAAYRQQREERQASENFRRRVFADTEQKHVPLLHKVLKAERRRAMSENVREKAKENTVNFPQPEDTYANMPELASSMLTFIPALSGVLFDLFECAKQKRNNSRARSEFRLPLSDTAVIRRVLHSLTLLCCFQDAAGLLHRSDGGYRRPAVINILSEILTCARMFDLPPGISSEELTKYDIGEIDGRGELTATVSVAVLRLIDFLVKNLRGKVRFEDNPKAPTDACIDEIFRFRRTYCDTTVAYSPLKPKLNKLATEHSVSSNQLSPRSESKNESTTSTPTSTLLIPTDAPRRSTPLPSAEEVYACTECFGMLITLAKYHNERKEKLMEENRRRMNQQLNRTDSVPRTQTGETDEGYYDYDITGLHHSVSNSSSVMDPSNNGGNYYLHDQGSSNVEGRSNGTGIGGILPEEDDGPTNTNVNGTTVGGWHTSILPSLASTPGIVTMMKGTAEPVLHFDPANLPNTVLQMLVQDMQPVIFEMVHLLNCNLPEPYGEIIRGTSRKFLQDAIMMDEQSGRLAGVISTLLHDNYSTLSLLIRGLERSASALENAYRSSNTGTSAYLRNTPLSSNPPLDFIVGSETPGFTVAPNTDRAVVAYEANTGNTPRNPASASNDAIGTVLHLGAIRALIPKDLPQKAREFVREFGIAPLARIIACPLSESLGLTSIVVDMLVRIIKLVDDDELYYEKVTEQWNSVKDAKTALTKQIMLQVQLEQNIIGELLRNAANTPISSMEQIHTYYSYEYIRILVKANLVDKVCINGAIMKSKLQEYLNQMYYRLNNSATSFNGLVMMGNIPNNNRLTNQGFSVFGNHDSTNRGGQTMVLTPSVPPSSLLSGSSMSSSSLFGHYHTTTMTPHNGSNVMNQTFSIEEIIGTVANLEEEDYHNEHDIDIDDGGDDYVFGDDDDMVENEMEEMYAKTANESATVNETTGTRKNTGMDQPNGSFLGSGLEFTNHRNTYNGAEKESSVYRQTTLMLSSPTGSSLNLQASEFIPSTPIVAFSVRQPTEVAVPTNDGNNNGSSTTSSSAPSAVKPTTSKFSFVKRGEKVVTVKK